MQIFGRTFRRQVQPRSKWVVALIVFAVTCYVIYLTALALNLGTFLWGAYRRLPLLQRQGAGHVMALALGVVWFSTACVRWRHRLYLAPPMRDLVTTPASPWQILRIATRMQILSLGSVYTLAFVLFLYPWFSVEWLLLLVDLPWENLGVWQIVLGGICSIVSTALLMVMIDSLALSANLLAASLGVGGVAPHYAFMNYVWAFVRRPVLYATLIAVGLMLFDLLVANLPVPVPALASAPLVQLGHTLLEALNVPGSTPNVILTRFPSVCWFDAITSSVRGSSVDFQAAILTCLAWLGGSAALNCLCLNRALSVSVRSGWLGVGAVRPADATKSKPRSFDPDAINGPLEGLLIRRIGRMGRATLRLVSRNAQAGAVDIHLQRTLLLCIPAVLIGWLANRLVPNLLETFLNIFERSANVLELRTAGQLASAATLFIVAMIKIHVWGMLSFRNLVPPNTTQSRDIFTQIFQQQGLIQRVQVTRGDNRYPLIEIYAIGFKDAVLLPVYYAMFWLLIVVATTALEALLLGLPADLVGWSALGSYTVLLQILFVLSLSYVQMYAMLDYRRSRLLTAVQFLVSLSFIGLLLASVIGLIGYLWSESIPQNRFAIAALGTVNILVIVNSVIYSLARWMYVRRRFDCEINSGRRMY